MAMEEEPKKPRRDMGDPTTYTLATPSSLRRAAPTPEEEKLTTSPEGKKFTDEGDEYILIKQLPANQMFLSRLLKGILPVSDVVEKDGKFFSNVTDIRRITDASSQAEIAADLSILKEVFGDWDKGITFDAEKKISDAHNLQVTEADPSADAEKKFQIAYHDFEKFSVSLHPLAASGTEKWNSIIRMKEAKLREAMSDIDSGSFATALKQRLDALTASLLGSQGEEYMIAIVKRMPHLPSILELPEQASEEKVRDKIRLFQNALSTRIQWLEKALKNIGET